MLLSAVQYRAGSGWSGPFPPATGERSLVLAFGSPSMQDDPAPLRELAAAYPGVVLAGCSTSGEIHQREVSDDSVSVAVVQFDQTRVRIACEPVASAAESEQAGRALAERLIGDGLRAVLVFSDGLTVNGTALADGLNAGQAWWSLAASPATDPDSRAPGY